MDQFNINKSQANALRELAESKGMSVSELNNLKGSDLALRYKVVNRIIESSPKRLEEWLVKFSFFVNYDLSEYKKQSEKTQSNSPVKSEADDLDKVAARELRHAEREKKKREKDYYTAYYM